MCGHVLLMLPGGRLAWVTNVSHLCSPVIEFHPSELHFFIVSLTIQLNIVHIFCRTQRVVALTWFFSAIIQLRSFGSLPWAHT